MKKIKVLMAFVVVTGVFLALGAKCYAGESFVETAYDIDNVEVTEIGIHSHSDKFLGVVLGFNAIHVPYVAILLYLIIQIILIKRYGGDGVLGGVSKCLKVDAIVMLVICLVNVLMSNFVIDRSNELDYEISSMFMGDLFWPEVINIVMNVVVLIFGIVCSRKMLRQKMNNIENLQDRKVLAVSAVLAMVLLGAYFVVSRGPLVRVVEVDWSFGVDYSSRRYNIKIHEGEDIGDTAFLVKRIDAEGVLVEYERGYYEERESNVDGPGVMMMGMPGDYKTEVVQQKMKWNVTYWYNPVSESGLLVDGGTRYYVRFEK